MMICIFFMGRFFLRCPRLGQAVLIVLVATGPVTGKPQYFAFDPSERKRPPSLQEDGP